MKISLGLLAVLLSSIAIAQPKNDALAELKNVAAGSSSMDGSVPTVISFAVPPKNGGSAQSLAVTKTASIPTPMSSDDHDRKSYEIRKEAVREMTRAKSDVFEYWGSAVKSLAFPYAMMRSGIEKGFAIGGEGALGYAAAAGLGVVGAVAGVPVAIFCSVAQFIVGFFAL